jgi:cytochrome c553
MVRGLVVIGAFVAALAAGLFLFVRQGFSTRSAPSVAEAAIASAARNLSVPGRYHEMRNSVDCSPQVFTEAGAHWADHCATCHANNGGGESLLGKTMYPRPPDMRLAATQTQSDGELYYTINNGVRLTGMPAFGEAGDNDSSSWKLVCFIRRLPKLTADEEAELKKLNPKTPDEIEEERQEEEFLNGGPLPPPPPSEGVHKH